MGDILDLRRATLAHSRDPHRRKRGLVEADRRVFHSQIVPFDGSLTVVFEKFVEEMPDEDFAAGLEEKAQKL